MHSVFKLSDNAFTKITLALLSKNARTILAIKKHVPQAYTKPNVCYSVHCTLHSPSIWTTTRNDNIPLVQKGKEIKTRKYSLREKNTNLQQHMAGCNQRWNCDLFLVPAFYSPDGLAPSSFSPFGTGARPRLFTPKNTCFKIRY